MSVDIDEATQNTKARAMDFAQRERDRVEEERRQHQASVEKMAKARQKKLDDAMQELSEEEQRTIRLHAACLVIRNGYSGNNPQEHYDDMALRLAQYAVFGKV